MVDILKVTDPDKIVTDPVMLSALAKQGIDKDYVELYQDYAPRSLGKEHSPYAKFYRDLISGKKFMVVSGLPMVDADGVKIEAGWRIAGINFFSEKNNLFWAKVQGVDVELRVKNNQPDGRKANDRLSYKPQLFLNGVEQSCGQSILLPVDPINSNYLENTLEWDYGICKRRLRIIEGSILGSWVFPQKPNGEVRIKYNQTGDYRLRLGQFKVSDDEEVIKSEDFDRLAQFQGYPVTISDSATYYPDAHVETTSVDGTVVQDNGAGATWAATQGAAGTTAYDSFNIGWWATFFAYYTPYASPYWYSIKRGVFLFDTSGLPDAAVISEAILSLYGTGKADPDSNAPTINIYSSLPASNTALAAGDYDSLGTTAYATAITYANWLTASPYWNDFTLNEAGIAAISKTGISKFGTRDNYDATNTEPSQGSTGDIQTGFLCYFSEKGNGYKPKLVVTYTTGVTLEGAATLAGVGTLAAFAYCLFQGAATLSGIGSLTASAVMSFRGEGTLSGTGTLSGIGRLIVVGKSALSGVGSLVSSAVMTLIGQSSLTGSGMLTCVPSLLLKSEGSSGILRPLLSSEYIVSGEYRRNYPVKSLGGRTV